MKLTNLPFEWFRLFLSFSLRPSLTNLCFYLAQLQRVGRTGRARDGKIIVFMTEGREEKNWDKAKDAYADVQNALTSNKIFELYVDGDRMLPKSIKPEVDKVVITAKPLDLTTMTMMGQTRFDRKTTAEEKKDKEKKKRDPNLNMPKDAFAGFRTAGQVALAAKKAVPPVSPGGEMRDRRTAALLTTEEETVFREKWQFAGNERLRPTPFDTYELPFELGHTGSALTISGHSHAYEDALKVARTIEKLDDSNPTKLDTWHEKMSKEFKPSSVELFQSKKRPRSPSSSSARPPSHLSLRRVLPEEEPHSSFC